MNDLERPPRQPDRYIAPVNGVDPEVIDIPGSGVREEPGLIEYWHIVLRNKGKVLIVAILGAAIGFLTTLPKPRIYQARTTLEIQNLNSQFMNMGNVTATMSDVGYNSEADLQTHMRVMQSRAIRERVGEQFIKKDPPADLAPQDRLGMWRRALNINPPSKGELWSEAVGMAQGSVAVRTSGLNRIVEVSCDSTNRQVAADFCNLLTQTYIEQNLESRWQATEYTGNFLTRQLQDLKVSMEKSQDELQAFLRESGLTVTKTTTAEGDPANAQEVRLGDLLKELSTAQMDRIQKQSKYELVAAGSTSGIPEILDDESLRSSQDNLRELRIKAAQLAATYTPKHTEVRKVEAQIAELEASLQTSRADVLSRLKNEFDGAKRREALIASNYQAQARLVSGQAEQIARYNLLQREVEAGRMLYDNLLQRTKEASVASALRANNIRVIDEARAPGVPYSPDVRRQITIGLMFGLALGVGLVILREKADRTLQDPGDITHYLGLPELGVIPIGEPVGQGRAAAGSQLLLGNGGNGNGNGNGSHADAQRVEMAAWANKNSLLAESYRTTLTSILFSRQNEDRARLLVFTSASPKEGKTTTVCNLGIALAEIHHRVLLIDGDMRRPRLHNVFGLDNRIGLTDLLLQKTALEAGQLDAACQGTHVPGVMVLTSGASRHNASSLLHSARLPELLRLARERFDTIIVDTPPMVNLADARVVARLADGLILVARSGVTTRDAALVAASRFAEDGIPILGSILNFWNPKQRGSSYYRYYYSGYYDYYGGGSEKDGDGGGDGAGDGNEGDRRAPLEGRPRKRELRLRPEFNRDGVESGFSRI